MSEHHLHPRRKTRLEIVGVALVALWLGPSLVAQETATSTQSTQHLVPADKRYSTEQIAALYQRGEQRVCTGDARKTIGMPCGGLCAGQLYVLGDGTLGCWQVDGNTYFGGTGQSSYDTYRPAQPIAQGFAIATRDAERHEARATLNDAGYDAIDFVGEYPRALIRYRAKDKPVPPVAVDLEVFSPFVPLSAKDSAWPATVLRFTVTNRADLTQEVALGGWLENRVFAEYTAPVTIRHRNRTRVFEDGLTSVLIDVVARRPAPPASPVTRVLADFESGTYQGWTVTSEAFGDKPATGMHPNQQPVSGFGGKYLVNSFTRGDEPTGKMVSDPFEINLPYLTFLIGGGAHEGKTCLNLVVDDKVVRSATGRNNEKLERRIWDISEFTGQRARLEIVDNESGGWGHINVDDIALTNALPDEYREYDEAGLGFGSMALSLVGIGDAWAAGGDREMFPAAAWIPVNKEPVPIERGFDESLVGAAISTFSLPPGQSRDVTFIVSWYFPNLHTGHRRMYTNWFKDARDVAVQLAKDLDRLCGQTVRFCDSYYRGTTLPWWLASRLMMPVSTLATGTAQWWQDGRFWAWEGAYCCPGTCTHVWNYAQADAWLFPELARSTRTMQDLGAAFEETSGLVGFRSDRNFAADGQAGTVLKCYREHLTSADDRFLRKHWSRIKAALEYLVSEDGDDNGIIENDRQHNTYDINFVGPNTFIGALYLAALRAGEEMAKLADDAAAGQRYHEIFERGRNWTVENLFNGEYFEQRVPPGDERPWQYGSGCLSDQLFGQNWAHLLGLGYLYPPAKVRSALTAVYRYNWAPDVGPLNAKYPPERWFARPGEPGLFVCTWPRAGRPTEPVRYRDEVWTGIEYQVAADLAWEGFTDEALLIVHGIDERYDGTKHNPWNEVECGDHYARALASWGVLHALAGFTFDGPAGKLALAPRIQKDEFKGFFCAGTGWGNLTQQRGDGSQVNTVELNWGTLRLKQFTAEIPAGTIVDSAQAILVSTAPPASEPRTLPAKVTQPGNRCEIEFTQPVELKAGQQLKITLHW